MRRSRWAEPDEEEVKPDEPVTLTESQYRALKRGALLGTFGLALGVAATGLAVWSLTRSPEESARPTIAQATAHPGMTQSAPAEPGASSEAPGSSQATQAAATPSAAAPSAPAAAPKPAATATKPAAATSTVTAARKTTTRKASAPSAPVEKPEPQPASSVLGDTPAPTPVSVEPVAPKAEPVEPKPEGTSTP